jgi:murein DD-endopeptidase MepM/ murein hydrolase activator NlpD
MNNTLKISYIALLKAAIKLSETFLKKKPVKEVLQLPVPFKAITQAYGTENWKLYPATGRHWGLDLRANIGTIVSAPMTGEVIDSGFEKALGYWLQFFDGEIYHIIPHLQGKAVVGPYKQGQELQKIGNTGKIVGVHCHLECWTERMVDRVAQLKARGAKITLDPAIVYKLK